MRNFSNRKFSFPSLSLSPKKLLIVGIIILVLVSVWLVIGRNKKSGSGAGSINNQGSSQNAVIASTTLGQNFNFNAYDSQGHPAKQLNFNVTKAELTSEVLVQGRPATAKGDKAFLVLHIEISNPEAQRLYIAPVDLLRIIDDHGKKYAPDIHSDVVEVQPISTKITRVGFVVLKNLQQFNIQIGELEGDKQGLEVKF